MSITNTTADIDWKGLRSAGSGDRRRAFSIEYLEAPIKTIGFLVIIDVKRFLDFNYQVAREFSAIRWAMPYRLPIIVAALNSTTIERGAGNLPQLIDYSPDLPVIWGEGDIDLSFVQRTMDMIYTYI